MKLVNGWRIRVEPIGDGSQDRYWATRESDGVVIGPFGHRPAAIRFARVQGADPVQPGAEYRRGFALGYAAGYRTGLKERATVKEGV